VDLIEVSVPVDTHTYTDSAVPATGTAAETVKIVWVQHDFAFLGGSLGCAEGEKITRAFEYAIEHKLPICVQCRTGGARMQEGVYNIG
jgi:acetyl-CoA carboxylase beta subunit